MGILNNELIKDYNGKSFTVKRQRDNIQFVLHGNGIEDSDEYVTRFCKEILNIKYNSVLLLGGAIGIVAQYIADNTDCNIIDVVELEQEVVDWVNNEGYLDKKINYVQGDAFTFTPKRTYDLIIMDMWWDRNITIVDEPKLVALYEDYVGSYLYIPILEKLIIK